VDIGSVLRVRQAAMGQRDELVWLSGLTLRARKLSDPKKDLFSTNARAIERLFVDSANGRIFAVSERTLKQYDLATGEESKSVIALPGGMTLPDQLVVDSKRQIWLRSGNDVFVTDDSKNWKAMVSDEDRRKAHAVAIDPAAERLVIATDEKTVAFRLADASPLRLSAPLSTNGQLVFESWLRSAGMLTTSGTGLRVLGLDGAGDDETLKLGPEPPTQLVGLPLMRGYAWGDKSGRLAVVRRKGTKLQQLALTSKDAAVFDADKGHCTQNSWVGWTCTCNTVTVSRGDRNRAYTIWDSARETWIHKILPVGTPLPPGAICTCNTVLVGGGKLWETICTCNRVCTCDTMCTCQGVQTYSYWYPN
jgi:hypothetical protein